jgi:organic radical activating enzyme
MRYSEEIEEKTQKKKLVFGTLNKFPSISEWFVSLEGEGNSIGEPSLYIRLNGCYSAKCSWCDSKYSWFSEDGENNLEKIGKAIQKEIQDKDIKRLTITGGEPLHFIDSIKDIVNWLADLDINFDFIGIESNGNLLQDPEIVMKTIKTFSKIQLKYNTIPTLTISPKLDAKECYGDELTQIQVNEIYENVIENCIMYLNTDYLYFKFVWDNTNENSIINNLKFIEKLKGYGLGRKHIMLMPWTPENPKTTDAVVWQQSQHNASRKALNLGIKYSPRLHIDIKMD